MPIQFPNSHQILIGVTLQINGDADTDHQQDIKGSTEQFAAQQNPA